MSVEYQIRETLSRIHQREARLNVGEVKGLPPSPLLCGHFYGPWK